MSPSEPGYADFLWQIGKSRPEVLVLDAGLATSTPTGKFAAAFPERYFNLGIAEQNVVGVASGLARRGFIPVVHSFANFLTRRAHDQIAVSVAWPRCRVKLVGCSCGAFDARNGPSHTAVDDLATMTALPGVFVAEPADLEQTRDLLARAIEYDGPAYLRLRRHNVPSVLTPPGRAADGTIVVTRDPAARATLVAGGSMLDEVRRAAERLTAAGLPIDLIHVSVLRPFEAAPVVESARRTRLVVTVENHVASGGFGDTVSRAVGPLGVVAHRLNLPDDYLPAGSPGYVLAASGLDAEAIAGHVARWCAEQ